MKKLNGREMKTLFILSIVVPVGLLTGFRLTGVLREPATVKRITLEPVTLSLIRPSETVGTISQSVQNAWTLDEASIIAGVSILSYLEGAGGLPFAGNDGLAFKTYVNASVAQGYLNTVKISFRPLDANAVVFVSEERWSLHLENATLMSLHNWGTYETDARLEVDVLNSPCSIGDQIYWVFQDEYQGHELQTIAEIVYADKTSVQIITIPIKITLSDEVVD